MGNDTGYDTSDFNTMVSLTRVHGGVFFIYEIINEQGNDG